ncbi:MAG TPA: hypothetical protein VKU41_00210 [Polyangiaceae bacterium]|nr:hypothetical protein [Polyangiaceae bacterium]
MVSLDTAGTRSASFFALLGGLALMVGCGSSHKSGGSNNNNNGDGGGASEGDAGSASLGACVSADTKACNSFAYPLEDGGMQPIQLGQYGAQMDVNVGNGFENTVQSTDTPPMPNPGCQAFAAIFGEPAGITNMLLQTSMNGVTIDFSLYSVYRPAVWPKGPVPVITWGNGTCAQPEGYGALLRYVASYGYVIVAANSRQVGMKNSDGSQPMLKALDFAAAANMDSKSPYYQHLDMTKVGAMGHSQGGGATITASTDPRIQDIFVFNGGLSATKPFVVLSGDMDVLNTSPSAMASSVNGASAPGAWLYYHDPAGVGMIRGHLVLMLTPDRVTDQTVSWWEMVFRNDPTAKAKFVGSSCGFCGHAMDSANAYEFGEHGLM